MPNLRGPVYLYRMRISREWLFKFYRAEQPSFVKPGEFELVTHWPDCNVVAAFGWLRHKFGSKECQAPNQGVYRLDSEDVAMLVELRKLPPGTTGRLWWEGIED